jgi:thymidine kinase
MAKLYFRYGTMGSAKTLNLLAVAHTYEVQEKRVMILKPALDTRFGKSDVRSRSGLTKAADRMMAPGDRLDPRELAALSCILVDEAQFLSPDVIDHLRDVSILRDIPVICYGLRTDFLRNLFPGSRRLLELADAIEEVKSTCHYCNKKAIFNMRLLDDSPVFHGPQVQLGADESYHPVCSKCYREFSADTVADEKEREKEKRPHLRPVDSQL